MHLVCTYRKTLVWRPTLCGVKTGLSVSGTGAGWKGRGVWADFGTNIPWHLEGGAGTTSKIVKFQIRPDPLAY